MRTDLNQKAGMNRNRRVAKLWNLYCALEKPYQFDRWIAAEMKKEKSFGKQDRRYYSDSLFAAMRHALFAAASVSVYKKSGKSADRADLAKQLIDRAEELSSWNKIKASISADTELFLEFTSRRALDSKDKASDDVSQFIEQAKQGLLARSSIQGILLWCSIPLWFESKIKDRAAQSSWSSENVSKFISCHDRRPPLWIRANNPETFRKSIEEFSAQGFVFSDDDDSISLHGTRSVYDLEPYKKGVIEIQDYASQSIGRACDINPGMYVWDACAGGGGKTMQIASLLNGKGAVYASDLREYKLEDLKLRSRRAPFSNVRTVPWNGEMLPEFSKEVVSRGGFHRVLVDAPCSSSGTWRRNPDGKYRITPEDISELSALQLSILENASVAVRADGLLIYATCSFITDENESVVRSFCEKHPEFSLVSSNVHGNPVKDSDTTFTAVFRKRNS